LNFIFIGASGFVGKYAMALARQRGHYAVGTQSTQKDSQLIRFNLLEDRIAECLPPKFPRGKDSYGIICASVRQIDQCYEQRDVTRQINVSGTLQLVDDLKALDIQPVFLSTSYVFDGLKGYYTETDERGAVCEYGRHKAEVEEVLTKKHPDMLILRLDKIVGDDPADEHLFTEWLRWLKRGDPITCIAGQILSPTLAQDIGEAILISCAKRLKGLYNTANMEFFSREELARQFLRILKKDAKILTKDQSEFTFKDPRPAKTYLDSTKFIRETGMRFTSMREVIERFAAKL
jgi:dTDP-4-dehydrorhamnose reductase